MINSPSPNSNNLGGTQNSIKLLCSYGGRILPRYPDGKLRYHGGLTRVLSVDRSISFAELLVKLREMCGAAVSVRCQLPSEDLDALVSVTCDEDLTNLIEEYDRTAAAPSPSQLKIRAFIACSKPTKTVSPPPSSNVSPRSLLSSAAPRCPCYRHVSRPPAYPVFNHAKKMPRHHGNAGHVYLVHSGNHWQ